MNARTVKSMLALARQAARTSAVLKRDSYPSRAAAALAADFVRQAVALDSAITALCAQYDMERDGEVRS